MGLRQETELEEVVIVAKVRSNVESTSNGTIELQLDKVAKLPLLLGEQGRYPFSSVTTGCEIGWRRLDGYLCARRRT